MAGSSLPLSHARFASTRVFGSLDGLRCLSILAVVWHHAATGPRPLALARNGFIGVDLFFVISGFLITTLLLRERTVRGTISLRRFWIRRTLRIFPPYFALLGAAAIALGLVFPTAQMRAPFFAELPFLATYTSNWVEITTLFGITWSLATEEQFYLLWPLVERFLARWVAPILVVGVALNQCLNFGLLDAQVEAVTGLHRSQLAVLQTTFTPILFGAALAHGLEHPAGFARAARLLGARAAAPFALAAVVAIASVPGGLEGMPRLALHVALTALVAACVLREDNGLRRLLAWRPVARLGAVSYGIYLYHLVALHGVHRLLGAASSNAVLFVSCAAVSVVFAEISYRVLEAPFLRLKPRFEAAVSR